MFDFIKDEDYKHYVKIFIGGFFLFLILLILFLFVFRDRYDVVLKKSSVEYGSNVRTVDLVESVAGNPVEKANKISSNTISVNGYEVTLDELDTYKLGDQQIDCKYTDSAIDKQTITVKIVDTKKPVIHINEDADTHMDLKNVKRLNVSSLFTTSDNQTPDSKIKIKKHIKEEHYSYGDTVHLIVQAMDISGNSSSKTIKLYINPKPEKKKKEKEEATEETQQQEQNQTNDSTQTQGTQNPSQQYTQQQAPVQQQPQQSATPAQTYKPKPSNKQYLFSQGYDMSSAPKACQSDLLSSGYTGSCTPIQGSDGIYLGMQLTFN